MADPLPATVPSPASPGAATAWYAPAVREQYRIGPDIVATVRDGDDGFEYETRTPPIAAETRAAATRVETYLDGVEDVNRPRTREGTVERLESGLARPYRQVVDRMTETTPDQRRRLGYHLTASVQGLGSLTPLALDDRIRVADASGDDIVVHTVDFAPARTEFSTDDPYLDRFLSERLARYTVTFHHRDVPVTVYRERVLGGDVFETKYHVHDPVRLPGDDELLATVEARLVEESVGKVVADRVRYVEDRARRLLKRKLVAESTRSALGVVRRGLRGALATIGVLDPPVLGRDLDERIDDLVFLVVRDLVGEDRLTIPIRDPHLERVEANRVGERITVVPRPGAFEHEGRLPMTAMFEAERRFVTLAKRLAGAGGVELGPRTPHASVSFEPEPGMAIGCSVALPSASADGPYISIDKRGLDPVTPVDALEAGTLEPELVGLLWLAIEHHQAIAIVGPERARPASLVEAHAPFVPLEDQPVTIADRTRSVTLPHETDISLTTDALVPAADGTAPLERATDLRPDVTVMTALEREAAFRHFGDALARGQGLLVSANADDFAAFAHRAVGKGLPLYTLGSLDLVLTVRTVEGQTAVTAVETPTCDPDGGRIVVDSTQCGLRAVRNEPDDADGGPQFATFLESLASRSGRSVEDLAAAHQRRVRYVRYLRTAGIDETDELFSFLADLRTDEAATVERIHRVLSE
ncbi:ATPase involved in archaellum/pili biosynthesis [Halanaeroarchaeum sp. HSR-CO]|uniref:secretion system protein n=1 Tax=Halanaeroarchaeum sp. HSR-CO TaxID=2866382 RepID=UPI00217EA13C|nr:secretion system protein [Halanaeroarchaeum sp. HSR-CO]UWG47186.1 ATPase involved in archaellum/pili biosynthesis [Halanaeroarchaeum sp. HSR-CO]